MNKQATGTQGWPRLAWNPSTWVHSAFALAAISLYILGGMAQSHVSGLPSDFDRDQLTYPVLVGHYQVNSEYELLARVAGEPVGYPLLVRSMDGSTSTLITTRNLYTSFGRWVTRINGLFFLAVSLFVFAPRVDKIPARDLFWACLLYGLTVMVGGIYPPQGSTWPGAVMPLIRITNLVIMPTLMLHVGLTFPRRIMIAQRFPWLVPAIMTIGLALAAWHFGAWLRWLEGNGSWEAIAMPRRATVIFLALFFGSGCVGMIYGYQRSEKEREREQVKWLLWGITMGSTPYIFLHALPMVLAGTPLLPVEVTRLFSVVTPIAMSFVVIRHKWLDVDIIIRRSLLYVLLASMMVGIYAVIGVFIGQRVEERWPETGPFVPIVATTVAAMLFTPTRQGFAQLIDRVIFKIRYNHNQALAALRSELRQVENHQQIVDLLAAFLGSHLRPNSSGVVLSDDDEVFQANTTGQAEPSVGILPAGVRVMALPGMTARPNIETEGFPPSWQNDGFVLAQAIEAEGIRSGHLLLGEKSTGRSYVAEDLDLLAEASREAAIYAHRISLKQDFVDEVVARHRVEEMNRFRTQFFAQFAHDLRSPLTSINWAARNILDGVVGEVSEPMAEYLEGIETSARQLVRLVNNLLEATRLESNMPEVEFTQVNLTGTVMESISKLTATADVKKLELVVESPAAAPVYGNEEKLLEMIDNLIENAIRYAPPETRIDIRLSAEDDLTEFIIEDQGPGLDPADICSIFEPYRQGAPSPHSTQQGFGLGLFVVKSWVERMGGQVMAGNRDDGGARFSLVFPTRNMNEDREIS
jgi:signal transduction histidine kinase